MSEHQHQHECDCGCEHEHDIHEGCDCGCEDDVVILQDENGNDVAFHFITTLEHEGKEYVYLQAADAAEDEEVEVEIFELGSAEENGETFDQLFPVEDDLYEVLFNKLLEEVEHESEDPCADCDESSCEGCESDPCADCEDDCADCDVEKGSKISK